MTFGDAAPALMAFLISAVGLIGVQVVKHRRARAARDRITPAE